MNTPDVKPFYSQFNSINSRVPQRVQDLTGWKKYALYALVAIFAFVGIVAVSYIILSKTNLLKNMGIVSPLSFEEAPPIEPTGPLTFVLLGHGGDGHSGGALMDSIILLSIDSAEKKALLVSVPRDTWIEGRKINEGYVAGGYDLIRHQMEVVTGILPENYVSINFDNFKGVIDALGGVDVNVPKLYEDNFYPIKGRENDTCGFSAEKFAEVHRLYSGYQLETQFTCRYEHLRFEPGIVHMDGETALKYVRSRHGDNDFGRSERQFVILNAIKDKLLSLKGVKSAGSIVEQLKGMVTTNMDLAELKGLASFYANQDNYEVASLHLTDTNVLENGKSSTGQFILIPKGGFSAVQAYIDSNY